MNSGENIFVGLVGSTHGWFKPSRTGGGSSPFENPCIFVENTPVTVELRDVIKLY